MVRGIVVVMVPVDNRWNRSDDGAHMVTNLHACIKCEHENCARELARKWVLGTRDTITHR